jgi:hypothetical protein
LKLAFERHQGRSYSGAIALGLIAALAMTPAAAADEAPTVNVDGSGTVKPAVSAVAMAEYSRALEDYNKVHDAYLAAAGAYWSSIGDKRKLRFAKRARNETLAIDDYVLTQPPVYSGPPKPVDPSAPKEQAPPAPTTTVPVVADFLNAALQEFNFTPRKPENDIDFKRAYAQAAAAAGLTKDQVVRIYSFEATGNGTYDLQAGLEYNTPGAHAITTALGYNQLLATNSVELMAEQGDQFVASLQAKAKQLPDDQRSQLEVTIAVVEAMIAFSRSVPDDWSQHQMLADTPKGLAIHAMNLDLDVGPLLQVQNLVESVTYARRKGRAGDLTAAELEMLNLTGDGNGFDMIEIPQERRNQIPTANFFQRGGYADNSIVRRNNMVATLLAATDAAMDEESKKPGAKDLAAVFPDQAK